MNPFAVGILILKVAACTVLFLIGLRLVLLSHETFTAYLSRFFGIADLETSPSTVIVLRVLGLLLVLGSLALVYVFFIPQSAGSDNNALLTQAAQYVGLV